MLVYPNQKGFGALDIILVAALVGLIGLAGWSAYQAKVDADIKQAAASSETSGKSTDPTQPSEKLQTFNCSDIFTIRYPASITAYMTDSKPPQCLLANVPVAEFPPVGPVKPEQIGLYFNTDTTTFKTNEAYVSYYFAPKEGFGYPQKLNSKAILKLDNGKTAILADGYGGHPSENNYHLFVHVKNGRAITTSFPADTKHKADILTLLKSIN